MAYARRVATSADHLPESIKDHRSQMLATIEEIRSGVSTFYAGPPDPFGAHLLEGASSLCIMGDRGAGKSTVLLAACRELDLNHADVVLPIQTPESFAAHDSVISAFLASLWRFLASASGDIFGSDEERNSLRDLVSRTAQAHAAARIPIGALEHGTDNPRDYADDAVSASRSYSRVGDMLRDVARKTFAAGTAQRLIIVPIDDPDFRPHSIREILRDVRQLGAVPGIVPIACVCPSDLEFGWSLGGAEDPRTRNLPRELEKVFPYRSRIELRPVPGWERPLFVPIGEQLTLGESVERLSEQRGPVPWRVEEFLARDGGPPGLSSPLPSNRRALVQLWEVLGQPKEHGEYDEAGLIVVLRRAIDIVSEPLRELLGKGLGETFYDIGFRHSDAADGGPKLAFEGLDRLRVGVSASESLDATRPLRDATGIADIRIRSLAGLTGYLRSEDPNPRPGKRSSETELKPHVLASLFAVNEFALGPSLFAVEEMVRLGIGTEKWVWLSRVRLGGRATDDRFFTLPFCCIYSEVARGVEEWNGLAEACSQGVSLSALLIQNVAGAIRVLDGGARPEFGSYVEALRAATLRYTEIAPVAPQHVFADWFENDLPAHFHEAFFDAAELAEVCGIHRTARESVPVRDDGVAVSADFAGRIQGLLASANGEDALDRLAWVGGYHEIASSIGIGDVSRLRNLQRRWREHTTRTRVGALLTGDSVQIGPGAGDFAPYETPEGNDLLVRARAYLDRRTAEQQRRIREQAPPVV